MKINCSLPFNNIKRTILNLINYWTRRNYSPSWRFRNRNHCYQPFLVLHNAVRKICDSANNLENMFFAFSREFVKLTNLVVSDLAFGLLVQPLFRAVIQSEISAIIRVLSILVYFFYCSTFFAITAAITFDRLLVLQLHFRYDPVVTTSGVTWVVIFI